MKTGAKTVLIISIIIIGLLVSGCASTSGLKDGLFQAEVPVDPVFERDLENKTATIGITTYDPITLTQELIEELKTALNHVNPLELIKKLRESE